MRSWRFFHRAIDGVESAQIAPAYSWRPRRIAAPRSGFLRRLGGRGGLLEVLQAEVGLLQAQRTLEQAKANLLQAHYALMDAMGIDLLGGER